MKHKLVWILMVSLIVSGFPAMLKKIPDTSCAGRGKQVFLKTSSQEAISAQTTDTSLRAAVGGNVCACRFYETIGLYSWYSKTESSAFITPSFYLKVQFFNSIHEPPPRLV